MITKKLISPSFNYLKDKQNLVDLLAALLLLSLPLSKALPNILLIALSLAVFFNRRKFKISFPAPLLLFVGAILYLFLLFIFQYTGNELDIYLRYFTSVLLLVLYSQTKNRKLIEYFFLVGLTVAVIGSYFAIFIYKVNHPTFILDIGDEINQLLWVERPYFGFMLALGIFISLNNVSNSKKGIFFLVPAVLFLSFSIYISARLGILLSIFVILLFFLRSKQIKTWAKLSLGGLFLISIILSLTLSKGLMSRMHLSADVNNKLASIKDYEPRFVIWPCSVKLITEEISFLTGAQNYEETRVKLSECYNNSIEKLDKREYFLKKRFNTHNQFFDFFLIGGILPFLLLLSVFVYVWFSVKYSFETKLLFILCFSFFFVENVLYRQLGCYLFGTFAALYLNKESVEKD